MHWIPAVSQARQVVFSPFTTQRVYTSQTDTLVWCANTGMTLGSSQRISAPSSCGKKRRLCCSSDTAFRPWCLLIGSNNEPDKVAEL
jgi:hypothetical protein